MGSYSNEEQSAHWQSVLLVLASDFSNGFSKSGSIVVVGQVPILHSINVKCRFAFQSWFQSLDFKVM